jgi:hypothetical protein
LSGFITNQGKQNVSTKPGRPENWRLQRPGVISMRRYDDWRGPNEPLSISNDNQVLTFPEWCRLNRLSIRTGRRLIDSGNGPVVTRLSPRRFGITVGNNRAWQATRAQAQR